MIFEFPFDLIVMARTNPPIPGYGELAEVLETDFPKRRLYRRNSLLFSLPPGNSAHKRIAELFRGGIA
jgi:hypothetical protein